MKKLAVAFMVLVSGNVLAEATEAEKAHDKMIGEKCPDPMKLKESFADFKGKGHFNFEGKKWLPDQSNSKWPGSSDEESQFSTTIRLDSGTSTADTCSYEWMHRPKDQAKANRHKIVISNAGAAQ